MSLGPRLLHLQFFFRKYIFSIKLNRRLYSDLSDSRFKNYEISFNLIYVFDKKCFQSWLERTIQMSVQYFEITLGCCDFCACFK